MCDAVAFAHSSGVVHRDLKPQNVMLGAFGEVLILDWGVARARRGDHANMSATIAEAQTVAGTPGYMAPEQSHGAADERSDVYGLGGILFFLLTRSHPTPGLETVDQWKKPATADRSVAFLPRDAVAPRDVPAPLRAICERARAIDLEARYQTVTALAGDVANYLDALPVAAHAEGFVERMRRVAIRHKTAIMLVLAYLAMRVALLIFTRR
jgi:serine/threonine-protein kinase